MIRTPLFDMILSPEYTAFIVGGTDVTKRVFEEVMKNLKFKYTRHSYDNSTTYELKPIVGKSRDFEKCILNNISPLLLKLTYGEKECERTDKAVREWYSSYGWIKDTYFGKEKFLDLYVSHKKFGSEKNVIANRLSPQGLINAYHEALEGKSEEKLPVLYILRCSKSDRMCKTKEPAGVMLSSEVIVEKLDTVVAAVIPDDSFVEMDIPTYGYECLSYYIQLHSQI